MNRITYYLATICLVGLALRAFCLSGVAFSNWDEGVYALSARWIVSAGESGVLASPSHGPPLYTLLLSLLFLVFGESDLVALWFSALAGTAAIPAVYLLGKSWYGKREGVMAAALTAVLPISVAFSRHALTDALFTTLFLWALYLVSSRKISSMRDWWVFIPLALASLTKYHGPGVLIIGLLVVCTSRFIKPHAEDSKCSVFVPTTRSMLLGLAAVIVIMIPWALFLIFKWDLLRLISNYGGYVGSITSPVTLAQMLAWGCGTPLLIFALAGLLCALWERRVGDMWLLAAVLFFLLFLMVYRPYPRLFLPLAEIITIAGARGILETLHYSGRKIWAGCAFAFVAAYCLLLSMTITTQTPDGYRASARQLNIPPEAQLLICAQEPLLFYLERPAVFLLDPEANELLLGKEPFYIMSDHWLERNGAVRRFFETHEKQFKIMGEWSNPLPADVVLNSRNHAALASMRQDRTGYHIRPITLWLYTP
jgi:4-amino-4-deoxy-L-arabinose transferase-like glycosyltransferase